ncbi:hypothetical protein ACLKMY_24910 [Paraburkholderia mimosarum]|uniref:hypothetical protein n=1 Tax=Paraburkholderia mimosarum TaxID=312026 RepID=UPI0039C09A5F
MTRTFAEPDSLEDIDRLCIQLFDNWCERRSVLPLAWLMHAWPILKAAPLAMTRLLNSLHELREFHPDALGEEDHQVIEQVLAINLSGNAGPERSFR